MVSRNNCICLSPIALRKAKTPLGFGHTECIRVTKLVVLKRMDSHRRFVCSFLGWQCLWLSLCLYSILKPIRQGGHFKKNLPSMQAYLSTFRHYFYIFFAVFYRLAFKERIYLTLLLSHLTLDDMKWFHLEMKTTTATRMSYYDCTHEL